MFNRKRKKNCAYAQKSWAMLKRDIRLSLQFNECANKITLAANWRKAVLKYNYAKNIRCSLISKRLPSVYIFNACIVLMSSCHSQKGWSMLWCVKLRMLFFFLFFWCSVRDMAFIWAFNALRADTHTLYTHIASLIFWFDAKKKKYSRKKTFPDKMWQYNLNTKLQ